MIRKIALSEVPPKRGVSKVTLRAMTEFNKLKDHLNKNPLSPYEVQMVTLEGEDFKNVKAATLKNATLKLTHLTKEFIQEKKLHYRVFTRQSANGLAMYVSAA
jgi:hypothetical protein